MSHRLNFEGPMCPGEVLCSSCQQQHKRIQERYDRLVAFVNDIATNYDHDSDAHKYGTTCRVCEAEALLAYLEEDCA